MKRSIAACAVVLLFAANGFADSPIVTGGICDNADPAGVLNGVHGVFEITADPQDPDQNLIYAANLSPAKETVASSIVVASIDGTTGEIVPDTLTTVADNFYGKSYINGPEFVQKPTGELGFIYSGFDGIHGVFRPSTPAAWNDFSYDVTGAPTNGSPSVLGNASVGAYPGDPTWLGVYTYPWVFGTCSSSLAFCYGALGFGESTDVAKVLTRAGYQVVGGSTQSPISDGYIYFGACRTFAFCGLYEGSIDYTGGFVVDSVTNIGEPSQAPQYIGVAQHPVTGTMVIFTGAQGDDNITVWEQPRDLARATPIGRIFGGPGALHFRVSTGGNELVLQYKIFPPAPGAGSYTVPVIAEGDRLVVGRSSRSPVSHGAGLNWLAAANKWALYYTSKDHPLVRCWITP